MVPWTVTFQDFSYCLELCFWAIAFKTILTLSSTQKYQSLSNESFKQNSAHMTSLNLISRLSFEPRFCMFIINVQYTKSKCLQSLASFGVLSTITFQFSLSFPFIGRTRLLLFNGVLFAQEIPQKLILLCLNYDIDFRLENIENQKQ